MEILYAIIIVVIAFIVWANISTKKLDKIGELALKRYFDTQNEKYKVMLCVLAATYQNANQKNYTIDLFLFHLMHYHTFEYIYNMLFLLF